MLKQLGLLKRREPDVWKGLAAGVIAGLAGSLVMNQFQALCSKLFGDEDKSERAHSPKTSGRKEAMTGEQSSSEEEPPSTVKLADAISEEVFDHNLEKQEKEVAGQAVHYAFGTGVGAAYGVMAELAPDTVKGAGIPFGTAVWLVADEAVVPLLGLSKAPTEYPISKHAYSLASHFVYGAATEVVRRTVRKML